MRNKNQILTISIVLVIILALISITLYYTVKDSEIACTLEAKICPDGSSVGRNPENNCEFDPCPSSDGQVYCRDEERNVDACIEIYQPVCGWFNPERVQCIKYPCAQTFGNSCFACDNEDILYYTLGECPSE